MLSSEQLLIQIFNEDELLAENTDPIFAPADFGGVIPAPGDLIALSTDPGGLAKYPRAQTVVERYFWPRTDPVRPVRVVLLVREKRRRAASRRRQTASASEEPPQVSGTEEIPFIIQQIYLCLRLSRETNDPQIANSLRQLAAAFAQRAIERGADPATLPGIER